MTSRERPADAPLPVADRQVRARFTKETITVYQAYAPAIAEAALAAGTFVAPFKRERMTWIKPSFLWMMHRSGWATKPGQERVLAVEMTREGFEWALAHATLSHYAPKVHADERTWKEQLRASPVRVQWDPERSVTLQPLPYRAIQIGLSGEAVERYVESWIVRISDVTGTARAVNRDVTAGRIDEAAAGLPREILYPLPEGIRERIGGTPVDQGPPGPSATPCPSRGVRGRDRAPSAGG
ncbi:DUF4291 domain-containing protein [Streptomyces lycii]|uniref:DUF4291 domain-containing protein n=1 Tax=Streptomyces lycii TaxID=2654337 RepID=A0ABQ7FBT3_9ACTN|nr:DUF4291 domain-containing protein [Streptomyces lycii]KAF4406554.1 DUF4291 domain-containing protein [Streptomyces lycii]